MIKYLRLEYFFIFMVLIWEPFQRFILKVDGAANTIALLSIGVLSILFTRKNFYKTAFRKPLLVWFVWVIYAFLSTLVNGYSSDLPISSFFLNIFIPFLLMVVISLEFKRNQEGLRNVLIAGLYFSMVLILVYISETEQGRIGGEMNSNTIGTMATVLIMLLYYAFYKGQIKLLWFIVLIPIPLFAIISTGSRTAFGGVALLLALHFFINRSRHIILALSKMVLGILLLILPFNYILENTGLGERILSTTTQSDGMAFETGNAFLDSFGDRGFFYYRGWEVFKENPILGIGLGNFKNYNQFELAQHSEYMIQLAELGVIGFLLFFIFYYFIFKYLIILKKKTENKREVELYVGYILIVLLMITATRMYRVWYLFSIIGIVIGYINQKKSLASMIWIKQKKHSKITISKLLKYNV